MVMSDKILFRGTPLAQTSDMTKGIKKGNSQITILLSLSKLKCEFITHSNIKTEAIRKNNQQL